MDNQVYEVKQVDIACWMIQEGGAVSVNCFLIAGEESALLIDSGFGNGDLKAEVEKLTSLPVILVNSHADGDHVLGNKQFGTAHMHPAEYDRYHGVVGHDAPVAPLWEGDVIDLGGRRFEVILIPGHTPGSIALLDEENRLLIGGDSIQGGMIFMFGPGRNITGYIDSMRKLKDIQSKFDTVYTGHGEILGDSDILDDLIEGAVKVRNGEVDGEALTGRMAELGAKSYKVGRAGFLYA